jgi:chloride channel protein, CIC family
MIGVNAAKREGGRRLLAVHGSGEMVTSSRYLEAPQRLRAFIRAHESSLVVLAVLIGATGGLVVAGMSVAVEGMHVALFDLEWGDRLSSQFRIEPLRALLVPSLGGLVLGVAFLLLQHWRPAREIDPIEANALHGGRMSFRGSVIVALQTVWSSGVGASVGLEAGYTQLASGLAASLGRGFHLRRADQRVMVGCGAAAAIAGAFGAPLAGSFYAFELVIGGYTPASLTPVGIAAVAGYLVAHAFVPLSLGVAVGPIGDIVGHDLALAGLLGILAALVGITIMRGVALCEALLAKTGIWPPLRPALGGLAVGLLALETPQVMSSGHGALHFAGFVSIPLAVLATMFALKAIASILSLGSGFRGGLFFATLFLGALGGAFVCRCGRHALAGSEAQRQRVCDHRHERAIGLGDRRAADNVVHRARIDRQSLAHHRRAGRGHDLDTDHPRTVRLFVRDLAFPPARRNHPKCCRYRLDPRPDGTQPDAV